MRRHEVTSIMLTVLVATFVAGSVTAQDRVRNTTERVQDHREVAQDRRELADDRGDLERFDALVAEWNEAVRAGDVDRAAAVYGRIAGTIQRDLRESRARIGGDRREVGRSGAELRGDRREIRRDHRQLERAGATGDIVSVGLAQHELRDDRRDRRDDRRDLRDDRDDLESARSRLDRKQDLARQLHRLQQPTDGNAVHDVRSRQAELLAAYRELMRIDLGANREELAEDRRELREDRRETREDRRQQR